MQSGEHDWPEEFRDEDKWLLLTKRQWLIMVVGAAISSIVLMPFLLLRLTFLMPLLIILICLVMMCASLVAFVPMPARFYLFGAGEKLEKILFRWLKKQRRSAKRIYMQNYENDSAGWGSYAEKIREARKRDHGSGRGTNGTAQ